MPDYGPESISMNATEGLSQVNEVKKKGRVPLYALFSDDFQ